MQNRIFIVLGVLLASVAQAQDPRETVYAPRTDWSESGDATLNISSFIFNDLNRNGSYDLGDRAMPAVAVALAYEEEGLTIATSNANGFANFGASTANEEAHITRPGLYTFEVIVPPGWKVSTANASQSGEAFPVAGSSTGIGFRDMMRPVGLVRDPFIHGTFGGKEPGSIELRSDGKRYLGGKISPGDTFTMNAPRGVYELSDGTITRQIELGDNPVDIGRFSKRDAPTGTKYVASFEDVTETGLSKVPNGYKGLNWFNLNAMRRDFTKGSQGYVNGATSGKFIAYTSSGHPAEITREEPFSLISMQVTGSWFSAEGETAIIEFWNGDEKLLTDQITISSLGPVRYTPEIGGVTRVRITSAHYWQLALDDIVVSY